MDIEKHSNQSQTVGTAGWRNFRWEKRLGVVWFQTVACLSSRKRQSKHCSCKSMSGGKGRPRIRHYLLSCQATLLCLAELQIGEILAEKNGLVSFGSKLLLAEAPERGRVSNFVANLCMEGKADLESGIDIYSAVEWHYFIQVYFIDVFLTLCCWLVCT